MDILRRCFEFPSHMREVVDGQNSPTKSSHSQTKQTSTRNKPSSSESYYSTRTSQTKSSSTDSHDSAYTSQTKSSSAESHYSSHTSQNKPSSRDSNHSLSTFLKKLSSYSEHGDLGMRLSENPNFLEAFTYLDLKQATGDFSLSSKLGEGEFGSVYKAVFRHPYNKRELAVKHLHKRYLQGDKEWLTEVNTIGSLQHPYLVKLVGYCAEDDEGGGHRFLLYEYLSNGSVKDHLSAQSGTPLSWAMRLQVAQDAAYCLAFLHQAKDSQVVFGNFKSSNVLLDDQWHAKLSHFGLGKLCGISSMAAENIGYEAPEYHLTGNATSTNDVWSYGVFLYELITGRLAFDQSLPKNEQKLVEWVKPYLSLENLGQIVDSRIQGHYSLQSVKKLSIIASRCLAKNPESRPRITDVLNMITQPIIVATVPLVPLHSSEELLVIETINPLVPAHSFEEASDPHKVCEENKSSEDIDVKGQRRFINRIFGICGCLPRICSYKR